ncbi:MAG: hypothetical protein AB7C95_08845 [Synergistaceae bacterium]
MGLWGRIFGTETALKETIGAVRDGIDSIFYTEEEKATDLKELKLKAGELLISWMETTKGQNIARRLLAIVITSVWLFMYLTSMALNTAVIWVENVAMADKIQASAVEIGLRATEMKGAMMLILGFYFAAPHMDKIVDAAMDKFNNYRRKSDTGIVGEGRV